MSSLQEEQLRNPKEAYEATKKASQWQPIPWMPEEELEKEYLKRARHNYDLWAFWFDHIKKQFSNAVDTLTHVYDLRSEHNKGNGNPPFLRVRTWSNNHGGSYTFGFALYNEEKNETRFLVYFDACDILKSNGFGSEAYFHEHEIGPERVGFDEATKNISAEEKYKRSKRLINSPAECDLAITFSSDGFVASRITHRDLNFFANSRCDGG